MWYEADEVNVIWKDYASLCSHQHCGSGHPSIALYLATVVCTTSLAALILENELANIRGVCAAPS
jgi:hypothetical protein